MVMMTLSIFVRIQSAFMQDTVYNSFHSTPPFDFLMFIFIHFSPDMMPRGTAVYLQANISTFFALFLALVAFAFAATSA